MMSIGTRLASLRPAVTSRDGRSSGTLISMDETRISLLQRLRTPGDSAAWADFVTMYEPLLTSYVRKKGVPEHDVADVVQTIYLSLLRAMPTFQLDKTRGRFRSWLYQVTVNAVTDRARRRGRRANREVRWGESTPEPMTFDPSPDEEWDKAYRERMFQLALEQVRERTNEVTWACFRCYLLEGRTGDEVAAELGLLPNTVRKNASRVLAKVNEQATALMEEMES
jgi:RNA polymerase sigma-70 factor (ECF subfamily)